MARQKPTLLRFLITITSLVLAQGILAFKIFVIEGDTTLDLLWITVVFAILLSFFYMGHNWSRWILAIVLAFFAFVCFFGGSEDGDYELLFAGLAYTASLIADGGKSDYAFGGEQSTFEPIKADKLLKDGDVITLGNTKITLLHHPGHTKGSSSFLFDVAPEKSSYRIAIINMPSIVVPKKFADVKTYPSIAADYAYTFVALENLQFDVWLSSHASQFGLHTKHKPGDPYDAQVFMDRKGYDEAVKGLREVFDKKLVEK